MTPSNNVFGYYIYTILLNHEEILFVGFEKKITFSVYYLTRIGKTLKKIIPTSTENEFLDKVAVFFKGK